MINILAVDDHITVLRGIKEILTELDYNVIATASSEEELSTIIKQGIAAPDIVFMDIQFVDCPLGGYKLTPMILQQYPNAKVIAYSGYCDFFKVSKMIDAGAVGFIEKGADPEILNNGITTVYNGGHYFYMPKKNVKQELEIYFKKKQSSNKSLEFTALQLEFIKHCITNLTYKDIAEKMGRSLNTIEDMRKKICEMVGVRTRQELTAFIMQAGLV